MANSEQGVTRTRWLKVHVSPMMFCDRLRGILEKVRTELHVITNGDTNTLHHARRYLMNRLEFGERRTPSDRNKLKLTLIAIQQGKCFTCGSAPLHPA